MLQTKSLVAEIRLEPTDLQRVLVKLASTDWKPVLLESERRILELAGVEGLVSLPIRDLTPLSKHSFAFTGDVFFVDSDMYYIFNNTGREVLELLSINKSEFIPKLEVGIISSDIDHLADKLQAFATAFQKCIIESLNWSKTQLDWKEPVQETSRLDHIASAKLGKADIQFDRAKLTPKQIKAVEVLKSEVARKTLIEISKAGFVCTRDILSKDDEIQASIKKMRLHHLLDVEYLLECKKSRKPLTRLAYKEKLENPAIAELVCPMCNNKYKDEILLEGYSVSNVGRKMIQKSHWMTIWVTNQLRNVGIPLNSILWNLSETGEEVDLLVDFMGELWIFELKDREFGAGDAYPLNYRRQLHKASKTIIITTDKVSKDARRVCEKLIKEQFTLGGMLIYVEGLDAVEENLRKEVSVTAVRSVYQKISKFTEGFGYDFRPIISAKFDEITHAELYTKLLETIVFQR